MQISVIHSKKTFLKLVTLYKNNNCFLYPIQTNNKKSYVVNKLLLLIVIIPKLDSMYIIPFNTIDYNNISEDVLFYLQSDKINFVLNRKFLFKYRNFKSNCIDVEIIYNLENKIIDINSKLFKHYENEDENIKYLPINSLISYIKNLHKDIEKTVSSLKSSFDVLQQYNVINDAFLTINESGIRYNNRNLYSNYNINTKTNRPTNITIDNVNLLSLSKNNAERVKLTSKYGVDGKLILFDYKHHVMNLLCNVVNYKFNGDVYENLKTFYQMKGYKDVSSRVESKILTFKILYSEMLYDNLEHPFFKLISDFITSKWNELIETGVTKSIIYKRNLYIENIKNKFTMFNYLMQNYETEFNSSIIVKLNNIFKQVKTAIILYIYDSILIDVHNDDVGLLNEVKDILTVNNKYEITVNYGDNFNEL